MSAGMTVFIFLFLSAFLVILLLLQKLLMEKHTLLGLIFPLISCVYTASFDAQIISAITDYCRGPITIEQYQSGMLIQKSTVNIGSFTNIPTTVTVSAILNISTIVLFVMFFVIRRKIKRANELTRMTIHDLG